MIIPLHTSILLNNINNCIINEEASSKLTYFVSQFAGSLVDTKLTKEQIYKMLENIIDIKTLKILSDHFYKIDGEHYIAYQPSDDEFLKKSNTVSIINKMSEYIYKYISNA